MTLSVEPIGFREFGPCECCGRSSRRISGFVSSDDGPLAGYLIHWTLGHVRDRGANIDLIMGSWGETTTAADRYVVSLYYRVVNDEPSVMVVDAEKQTADKHLIAAGALTRDDVIGTPLATEVFEIVDAVFLGDNRLADLQDPAEPIPTQQ
jgi:hypothetical protein